MPFALLAGPVLVCLVLGIVRGLRAGRAPSDSL